MHGLWSVREELPISSPRVAIHPRERQPRLADALERAAQAAGSSLVAPAEAEVLLEAGGTPEQLVAVLEDAPQLQWISLPAAGVEKFVPLVDEARIWTCARGAYGPVVAEHALALTLAGLRDIPHFSRANGWEERRLGRSLQDVRVTVLGGGDIARCFIRLLEPFGTDVTVVRNRELPVPGAARVLPPSGLHEALDNADVVVVALALTPTTTRIIDADTLDAMPEHSWLVNVARGGHVEQEALMKALHEGTIGGAALDVTDPEPLPADHPLWSAPNLLVTPHVANPPEVAYRRLAEQAEENLRRFTGGRELLGRIDPQLGY